MADIEYRFGDSFVGTDVCLFVAGGFVAGGSYFIFSFDPMMKIVLIGAGNVATHLGIALQKAGCLILQVYSRTEESASALAARLSVDYTIVPDEIRRDADLYIVALKDAVLRQLAPVLVKGREQALFVHTAGSMPMDLWKGLVKRYGVLYPMQTFSKQREVDFNTVPFFYRSICSGRSGIAAYGGSSSQS